MKIELKVKGTEFEVVAVETTDHSYENFMQMYVALTEWMTENSEQFKKAVQEKGGLK